jgi:hypothetical protein
MQPALFGKLPTGIETPQLCSTRAGVLPLSSAMAYGESTERERARASGGGACAPTTPHNGGRAGGRATTARGTLICVFTTDIIQ